MSVHPYQSGASTTWARRGEDLHRECTHQETGGFGFTPLPLFLSYPKPYQAKTNAANAAWADLSSGVSVVDPESVDKLLSGEKN